MTRPTHPEPFVDLDWSPEQFKVLADRAVGLSAELIGQLRTQPIVRRHDPADVAKALAIPVPDEPMTADEITEYLRTLMFGYSQYFGHPGFLGYIMGSGTVPGPVGDLVASVMNQNLAGWMSAPGAAEIELHVMKWFAGLFGLPETSGGVVASGGAMANFVALKVARDSRLGWDVRITGVGVATTRGPAAGATTSTGRPTIYASDEAHVVIDRAADMLGLGSSAVRRIPTDDTFRMNMPDLESRIEQDIAAGCTPIAVVATAGTTETGAIDPLPEIAALCTKYNMWLHVDACYGGGVALNDDLRPLLRGIELADSIAFDPHKWMYLSQTISCALFRDFSQAGRSYAFGEIDYVTRPAGAMSGLDLRDYGPMFSRGFTSLKVWISLLSHGRRAYAQRIAHDIRLAEYLAALVEDAEDLELLTPVGLSICCFRYVPKHLPQGDGREAYLNALNQRVLGGISMTGRVACSNAILRGKFALRACVVNFRTEAEQMDQLVGAAQAAGAKLDAQMRPAVLATQS